ncbi:MAG: hypothetical protein NPIRA05_11580 [Nitrospirales bacterium]|nr:MAG: hypothetical protein NPIRA05_11580 [Nitrospirales bacterium]
MREALTIGKPNKTRGNRNAPEIFSIIGIGLAVSFQTIEEALHIPIPGESGKIFIKEKRVHLRPFGSSL